MTRPDGRRRRAAFRLAVGALLLWCAGSCALEVYRCGWIRYNDPWPASAPDRWRFTSRHVAALRTFLTEVAGALPPGSEVAVTTEPGPGEQRFFRAMWIAYLLPALDVRQAAPDAPLGEAEHWLAYGTRLERADLELVTATADGALYRRRTGWR